MGRGDILMTTKKLDQFLCDYFRDSDIVEINAKWLQEKIQNYEQNKRLQHAQITEYKRVIDQLYNKVEVMKISKQISEIENNVVYRVDVRA